MSANLKSRIIDGDGHIMEDNAGIIAHMDGAYRDILGRKGICFPPLDHLHAGRAVETPPQRDQRPAVGPQGWLDFLDDVGIDWTVMYPTVALSYGKIVSRDYAIAYARHITTGSRDTYSKFNSRFKGMAIIPMQDPKKPPRNCAARSPNSACLGAMMPSNGLAQPLGRKTILAGLRRSQPSRLLPRGPRRRPRPLRHGPYEHVRAGARPRPSVGADDQLRGHSLQRHLRTLPARAHRLSRRRQSRGCCFCFERLHASHETHFQYIPEWRVRRARGRGPEQANSSNLIKEGRVYLGIETEELTLPFAIKAVGN